MKRILTILLFLSMLATILTSCGGGIATSPPTASSTTTAKSAETTAAATTTTTAAEPVVEIHYPTYEVGAQVGAEAEKIIIDTFNEEYDGQYKIVKEEIPSEQGYHDKMKVLASSGDLPDLVNGKSIWRVVIPSGQVRDLMPYLEKETQYRTEIGEVVIEDHLRMTNDGKIYAIPDVIMAFGYFYNKEMFEQVGIVPAETWEEWETNCQKLKEAGITPLAFNIAWFGYNPLTLYCGTQSEEARLYCNTIGHTPEEFDFPPLIEAIDWLGRMLRDYSMPDCLDDLAETQMNNFCQEKAAIIPNGSWMIGDFTNPEKSAPDFGEKIGVALFPMKSAIVSYDCGYMNSAKDDKVADGVWEAIKWYTNLNAQTLKLEKFGLIPIGPLVEVSEEYKESNPITYDMVNKLKEVEIGVLTFDKINDTSINTTFRTMMPEVVTGNMTAEELAQELAGAAARIQ